MVGQDGILRGDWQSPRVPIANRHAGCHTANLPHMVLQVRRRLHEIVTMMFSAYNLLF